MPLDQRETDTADMNRYDDDDLVSEEPQEPDVETTAEDELEEPSLDDLDPAVRERVDAYLARQQEQQRARFIEQGLDINPEGRLLIADAARVQQWGGPVLAPRSEPPQSAAPPPLPAASAAPEEPEAFDPLAADAAMYERFTERVAERAVQKATGPLLAEIQRLQGLSQRRAESEAMARVRDSVQTRMPEISQWLDHPDFETAYRAQIANLQPEYLDDPVTLASVAGLVRARLDPNRMPARRENPAAASLVLNQANRANLGGTPPSRQGGSGPPTNPGRTAEDEWGVRFLGRMRENMSGRAAERVEVSPEAWNELAIDNLDDYKRAKAERLARQNRGTGRRGGR